MFKPKKSLGQNFLKDKNIANKIINSVNIFNNNIIEIGPGLGILTEKIIKLKPKKLIIIEKDVKLYEYLIEKFQKEKVVIINEDALKYNYSELKNYKLVSNLPYNISSKFIFKIIKLNYNFSEILCMVQSELADKFDYKKEKMNKHKFISKYLSEYRILFNVSSNVFFPKPKVESKVVKFILKKQKIDSERLDKFITLFFSNRRKKIKSNKIFKNYINQNNLDMRFEDLEFNDILKIYERFDFSIS